jgi:hypothetical protein
VVSGNIVLSRVNVLNVAKFATLTLLSLLWLCRSLFGLGRFSVSWSYAQAAGLLGRGISPSQGLYLHTEQHKNRINAHNTDICALSGTGTLDRNVRASEDISCLRPRGHCDRPLTSSLSLNSYKLSFPVVGLKMSSVPSLELKINYKYKN